MGEGPYWAHSPNPTGHWHPLRAHLRAVGTAAEAHAAPFGGGELARLAGLWHDAGKYSPGFQAYLLRCAADPERRGRGPDHKAAGALAVRDLCRPLALALRGHHGGLGALEDLDGWLAGHARGADAPAIARAQATTRERLPELAAAGTPGLPADIRTAAQAELFLRMVFSAVVDADHADTERHFCPPRADARSGSPGMAELLTRLGADQARLPGGGGALGRARRAVYEACMAAADGPPGLYRLAAPTGTGKTRAALAFGLAHAARHKLGRVVLAVPAIALTEQAAGVYRAILGGDDARTVLEHHSGLCEGDRGDQGDEARLWRRLSTQTWDAPTVVTTTVQLVESLFAARPGRCRKVHRLAGAVLVLDEPQGLPAALAGPILAALGELCRRYGTTVLLCTATQPAFDAIPGLADLGGTDIAPDPQILLALPRRRTYDWRTGPPLDPAEIAALAEPGESALWLLNTRADARAVARAVAAGAGGEGTLHLSSALCGAHRRDVLAGAAALLAAGGPCRLVATGMGGTGLDLDFPTVLRALCPLDGIAQAGGRCNREGKLGTGRVVIFRAAGDRMPRGAYRTGADVALGLAAEALLAGTRADPEDPATARLAFARTYRALGDPDPRGIARLREAMDYPRVARAARMIDDDTEAVAVPYRDAEAREALLARLRAPGPAGPGAMRRLQPWLVAVPPGELRALRARGHVRAVRDGLWELTNTGRYDPLLGLLPATDDPAWDDPGGDDPSGADRTRAG